MKLSLCRNGVQPHSCGYRGRTGHPLDGIRRPARIRGELLSNRQRLRLEKIFEDERRTAVDVTCRIFLEILDALTGHNERRKMKLARVIDSIRTAVHTASTTSPTSGASCINGGPMAA